MRKLTLLLLLTACTQTDPAINAAEIKTTRADALWVTLSHKAAAAVAEAIQNGELPGTAERVANAHDAEAWRFEGIEPSDISRFLHERFHHCGGFVVHDSQADAEDSLDETTDRFAEALTGPNYSIDQQAVVEALLPNVDESKLHDTILHLSTAYKNRYYKNASGKEAAEWIADSWRALATDRPEVSVELFTHRWTQPSVIMTIPGTTFPDEVIVMGGHLDSIAGWSPGPNTAAPGADDDASGIATLTEAVRVLLVSGFKPQRTIKIMGYAGEEAGLLGSADIAAKFARDAVNVVGVLQLDMTNYSDGGRDEIVLISDYTNEAQNAFMGTLIDTYVKIPWGQMTCDYACSDHASWTKHGFASSLPFETHDYNPNIHSADDTLANMVEDASHAAKFTRLAIAYAVELAKPEIIAPPPGM